MTRKMDMSMVDDERTVLRTKVGDVVLATLKNGRTGKEHDFYRFTFSNWVNIIALTRDGELVLVRQYRFGTGRVELEIPGGAIEEGESPIAAGRRELLEETGYGGQGGRVIGKVHPNPALQHNCCYTVFFDQVDPIAEQNMDEMEDIQVLTLPLSEVEGLVSSGEISHGLVLNALMFYHRLDRR